MKKSVGLKDKKQKCLKCLGRGTISVEAESRKPLLEGPQIVAAVCAPGIGVEKCPICKGKGMV